MERLDEFDYPWKIFSVIFRTYIVHRISKSVTP